MKNKLEEKAKEVLENNFQQGGFTIPSKNLYPFQWKWDSGFIALGYAHYNIERAKQEIKNGNLITFYILSKFQHF